jgi:hypothetical protein
MRADGTDPRDHEPRGRRWEPRLVAGWLEDVLPTRWGPRRLPALADGRLERLTIGAHATNDALRW